MKMAADEEEDDLEALRVAVLASMKNKVVQKTDVKQELSGEEDPELAALRAAALKTKGQNSSASDVQIPKPLLNSPVRDASIKSQQFQYVQNRGGLARGRGRGHFGRGRGGNMPGTFQGGKKGSNLIVINTQPEPGSDSLSNKDRTNLNKDNSATSLLLRPQDKWASSVSDSNSAASTPTRAKVSNKFSRYDSSGSDSDSESDNEESFVEENNNKSSEEDDDVLNLLEENTITEPGVNIMQQEESSVENVNNPVDENINITIPEVNISEQAAELNTSTHQNDNVSSSSNLMEQGTLEASISPSVPVNERLHDGDLRRVINPNKSYTVLNNKDNGEPVIPASSRNVKSRLGIQPVANSSPDTSIQSRLEPRTNDRNVDTMTAEEKKLFEARHEKFMKVMEVQDLKKTVSLKSIISSRKTKKELPKQYRHRRNRSRSGSRSPSGKVSSTHRKKEKRKQKKEDLKPRSKTGTQIVKDLKSTKVKAEETSDKEDTPTGPLSDSDSSDSEGEPWRFSHTGKSGQRHHNEKQGTLFERRSEDIKRERRQRENQEREARREKRVHVVKTVSRENSPRKIVNCKTALPSVVKLNSIVPSMKSERKKRTKSVPSPVHSNSSSSSDENTQKRKDARSIILSLRNKDETESVKIEKSEKKPVLSEGRVSPVVNITFNSEKSSDLLSKKKSSLIHRRLGLPVEHKSRSSSKDSSRKSKRKVIEEDSPESKPLKLDFNRTEGSVRSRLKPLYTNSDYSSSKSRRRVHRDDENPIRDRTKSTSDVNIKTDRYSGLNSLSAKRKSTDCTESDLHKKIKLNELELNTSVETKDNHSKGSAKTPDEIFLDERIKRIQEKNQAIEKRRLEIMEDKKKYG